MISFEMDKKYLNANYRWKQFLFNENMLTIDIITNDESLRNFEMQSFTNYEKYNGNIHWIDQTSRMT